MTVAALSRDPATTTYDLDTPLGVAQRLVDVALLPFDFDNNLDVVPALVCNPSDDEIFAQRWRLHNIDGEHQIHHSLTFDGWTVEEHDSTASVTVRISVRFPKAPVYDEVQHWTLTLERTDRWRVCSSTQTNAPRAIPSG